jgi:hypothetical protein
MVHPTRQAASEALHNQPFTAQCRDRHVVVPVYARNLLGEKIKARPIGYAYRLK